MQSEVCEDVYVCSLCGGVFTGWGNNPWPVDKRDCARCCDLCNAKYVVPARIKSMMERSKNGRG